MNIKKIILDLYETMIYFDDITYKGQGSFNETLPNRLKMDIEELRDYFNISGTYFEMIAKEEKTMIENYSLHSIIVTIEIFSDYLNSMLKNEPADMLSGDELFDIAAVLKMHFGIDD